MPEVPGDSPELARRGAIHRTIPDAPGASLGVTTSPQYSATALEAYRGKWVYLKASGADVAVARGDHTGGSPLSVANGFPIADGAVEEFFVDPRGAVGLTRVGSAAGDLYILSDSEL